MGGLHRSLNPATHKSHLVMSRVGGQICAASEPAGGNYSLSVPHLDVCRRAQTPPPFAPTRGGQNRPPLAHRGGSDARHLAIFSDGVFCLFDHPRTLPAARRRYPRNSRAQVSQASLFLMKRLSKSPDIWAFRCVS